MGRFMINKARVETGALDDDLYKPDKEENTGETEPVTYLDE